MLLGGSRQFSAGCGNSLELSGFAQGLYPDWAIGMRNAHLAARRGMLAKFLGSQGEIMEEIMTPSEVASMLKIHLKTVYKLAEKGVIPGSRIGRSWRFSRSDVLELVSSKSMGLGGNGVGDVASMSASK